MFLMRPHLCILTLQNAQIEKVIRSKYTGRKNTQAKSGPRNHHHFLNIVFFQGQFQEELQKDADRLDRCTVVMLKNKFTDNC